MPVSSFVYVGLWVSYTEGKDTDKRVDTLFSPLTMGPQEHSYPLYHLHSGRTQFLPL